MFKEFFITYFKGDRIIWAVIGILFIFSLLAVYSASGTLAYKYMQGDTTYYLFRHALFLISGLGIIYITHRIPYKYFSKLSQWLFVVSIPLLLLTLLIGVSKNEAARWLTVPGIGINFQTSDLAKFALIMYIARVLSQHQDNIGNLRNTFKPLIINIAIVCLLIFPANFSTAALLFATSWVLMYVGRIPFRLLLNTLGALTVLMALFVIVVFTAPDIGRFGTWKNRIENFIGKSDSETNKKGNYQVEQSKIAIATAGFFGKGPGRSEQRNFLPHPYSDFIFAIIIEEYGSFGGLFIMSLYLYLLYRTGVIIRRSERTFPALLAIGLTLILVLQAVTNMAVAVNLLPVTGQTLPLISMGGTSIIFTSIALGVILSVSRSITDNEEANNTEDAPIADANKQEDEVRQKAGESQAELNFNIADESVVHH